MCVMDTRVRCSSPPPPPCDIFHPRANGQPCLFVCLFCGGCLADRKVFHSFSSPHPKSITAPYENRDGRICCCYTIPLLSLLSGRECPIDELEKPH